MKFTSLGLSDDLLEASKQVLQNSKEYEDFFKASLKKFNVSSPADFKSDEEKKKFFDYIDKNYKGEKSEEAEIKEKDKPAKKFIKLGDNAEKKNVKEATRTYFKTVDDLAAKHGDETGFIYKSPKLSKILSEFKKLIKSEVKSGFKDSKKYGEQVMKHLQKMEVMVYDDNVVMTNSMHGKFSKSFEGDTAFREDMASIIIDNDEILAHAIFGV